MSSKVVTQVLYIPANIFMFFDCLKAEKGYGYKVVTGKFLSPFENFLPGVMPMESRKVK